VSSILGAKLTDGLTEKPIDFEKKARKAGAINMAPALF
jgi:hypothetical protein